MPFYSCPRQFIKSATGLQDKINKMCAIIEALEDAALAAAGGEDTAEYSLDDGQTKIRATARSGAEIAASIDAYERILQRYINQYNGRAYRLVDHNATKRSF